MSDFLLCEPGQMGPMGVRIKEIIVRDQKGVVYMDENEVIQWSGWSELQLHDNFGEIQNKISYWESLSNKLFSRADAYDIKTILAEAYARILIDQNIDTARDIVEYAKARIEKHGCEILKLWYSLASFFCTLLCIVGVQVIRAYKYHIITSFSENIYEIYMTMLFGGIGAFIFATIRLRNYSPELVVSKKIHAIDGVLRIFFGVVAGLIAAVAIKSDLVFGFLNEMQNSIYVTIFIGLVAGASESLIPNIIRQVEKKTIKEDEPDATQPIK